MTQASARTETKSAARLAFAHYLRTGQRLADSELESNRLITRLKFNPNHDPGNGRFTFGPGSSAFLGSSGDANIRAGAVPSRGTGQAKPQREAASRFPLTGTGTVRKRFVAAEPGHQPIYTLTDIGARSAKYETPRSVNPGAIGRNKGDPGGPSYGTFQLSGHKGTLGEFIPQTVFSTNVQHGPAGGGGLVLAAIKKADEKFKRSDPGHKIALINNIYDARLKIRPADRVRYVRERLDALLDLVREQRQ